MKGNCCILGDPYLLFGDEAADRHFDPKIGLTKLHPFDYNVGERSFSNIRVAVITASDKKGQTFACLRNLLTQRDPGGAGYGYPYPGFESVYKVHLDLPDPDDQSRVRVLDGRLVLPTTMTDDLDRIMRLYLREIQKLQENGVPFDVLIVYVPSEVEKRYNTGRQNFRATLKAKCIEKQIKTQILTDSALSPYDWCDNVWNVSLALYVKRGGVPWKVNLLEGDICFVGITFGILREEGDQIILVGLAEVFDRYGEHIDVKVIEDAIPIRGRGIFLSETGLYLSRQKAYELLREAIQEGYVPAKGDPPSHVVVHKTTPFKKGEVQGIQSVLGASTNLDLVHIQADCDVRLYPERGGFPAKRGAFWIMDKDKSQGLLYTTGVVPILKKMRQAETYPGPGTPNPVKIKKNLGETHIQVLAEQILALTKMNWNSTRMMSSEPITLDYAREVIPLLKAGLPPERIPKDASYYY